MYKKIIFIISVLVFLISTHFLFATKVLYSQDEYGILNGAISILKGNKIQIKNNIEKDTNIMYPDFTTYKESNEIYRSGFPYTAHLYAILYTIFGHNLHFFFLILSFWLFTVFYSIGKYFSNKSGLVIGLAIITIPSIFYFRLTYFNNLLVLGLIIMSYLLLFKKNKSRIYEFLSYSIGGVIMLMRIPEGFLLLAGIGVYLVFKKNYKSLLLLFITSCFFVISVLFINKYFYNDFTYLTFIKPYLYIPNVITVGGDELKKNPIISAISYFLGSEYGLQGFYPIQILKIYFIDHIYLYLNNKFWPIQLSIIVLIYSFINYKKINHNLLIIVIGALFISYFYGNRTAYFGYGDYKIPGSHFRYNMLFYVPLCILLFFSLKNKTIFIKYLIISIFILGNIKESLYRIIRYNNDKINNYEYIITEINNTYKLEEQKKIIWLTGPNAKYLFFFDKDFYSKEINNISLTKLNQDNQEYILSNLKKLYNENKKVYTFIYVKPPYISNGTKNEIETLNKIFNLKELNKICINKSNCLELLKLESIVY